MPYRNDSTIFPGQWKCEEKKKRKKGRFSCSAKGGGVDLASWTEVVYLHRCQLLPFLESVVSISSICIRPGVRWSPPELWDVCQYVQVLQQCQWSGVHGEILSSGALGLSLSSLPDQEAGRRLETLVWWVVARYLRKLEQFKIQVHRYLTKPQR